MNRRLTMREGIFMELPRTVSTEEELEDIMTTPSEPLVCLMKELDGDLMILGIGGKMGFTLGRLALRACQQAGVKRRIVGVSRFSDASVREKLEKTGIETISCDLLELESVRKLAKVRNVVFMAGRKFGTSGSPELTWVMNIISPAHAAEHFRDSRIVAFLTGNVYPLTPVAFGGATEEMPTDPVGEYAQSCLGREQVFIHFGKKFGTPVAIIRLNYAIDLRYGVLHDVCRKVLNGEAIDLTMGHANVIWQGDANTQVLLALKHCAVPPAIFNVTGPEVVSIRYVATEFGRLLGKQPVLQGSESSTALLSNSARAMQIFGYPRVSLHRMLEWTAHWLKCGGKSLDKPTHFEVRTGRF
jgi:nucleoside-diphosphate-sugar epimerase